MRKNLWNVLIKPGHVKKLAFIVLITLLLGMGACMEHPVVENQNAMGYKASASVSALSPVGDVVGKVTVGYQGWFSAAGDGSRLNKWGHQNLENWPDMREYAIPYQGSNFYQAGVQEPQFLGNLNNGQPATMFSSYNQQTANLHCQWMQQNGIDCIALQRFGSVLPEGVLKEFADQRDLNMMRAAETYGRKFYIMYDCNTASPTAADWTNTIINTQHLTSSPAYAKQNGKPVVAFFGVGKADRGAAADWITMINWFKAQGCYVIGCPLYNFASDAVGEPAYSVCDMLMAWHVGLRSTYNFQTIFAQDLAFCTARGIDYQADIFPGSAFSNTNGETKSPKNQIPRNHGDFMWQQFVGAKSAGVNSIYISMFDEMNEGTSIFKCAEDNSMIPAGKYFLTLDADGVHVSSDFYLRLTGDGGRMIKGQIPLTTKEPTPFVVSYPVANSTYKIVNRGSGLTLEVKGGLLANKTPIDQNTYTGASSQQWRVTGVGNGQYRILGVQSNRSLDVPARSTADNVGIELYDYSGGTHQAWILTPTSDGYYTITSVNSNKVLEVAGSSTTAGALIVQNPVTGALNQQWIFQTP